MVVYGTHVPRLADTVGWSQLKAARDRKILIHQQRRVNVVMRAPGYPSVCTGEVMWVVLGVIETQGHHLALQNGSRLIPPCPYWPRVITGWEPNCRSTAIPHTAYDTIDVTLRHHPSHLVENHGHVCGSLAVASDNIPYFTVPEYVKIGRRPCLSRTQFLH